MSTGPTIEISRWLGGLGNNLIQIVHGIYLAKQKRAVLIMPDKHKCFTPRNIDFRDGADSFDIYEAWWFFKDIKRCAEGKKLPKHTYNALKQQCSILQEMRLKDYQSIFREYVYPLFDKIDCHKNSNNRNNLVIHIRSSDVFNIEKESLYHQKLLKSTPHPIRRLWRKYRYRPKVHPSYGHPPLCYYDSIINSKSWDSIKLVAEDRLNPVIPVLLKRYPTIIHEPQSLNDDIREILGAENLIIGTGTFAFTLALSSPSLKVLYTPKNIHEFFNLHSQRCGDLEIKAYDFLKYSVMKKWKNTNRQKNLMIEYPLSNIARV